MPEIEIRPVKAEDIPVLAQIDPDYVSEYVWQMDFRSSEEEEINVSFRQIHLPRSVKVEYPRPINDLTEDWMQRHGFLVAVHHGDLVGYISLSMNTMPLTALITDLVVVQRMRRQGIASALILLAQEWAQKQSCRRLMLAMQPKNYPAICLAKKLGFVFAGYNDHYFPNQDIALFFAKQLR